MEKKIPVVFIGGSWAVGKTPALRKLESMIPVKTIALSRRVRKLVGGLDKEEIKSKVRGLSQSQRVELHSLALDGLLSKPVNPKHSAVLIDGHYVGYDEKSGRYTYFPLFSTKKPGFDLLVLVHRPAEERLLRLKPRETGLKPALVELKKGDEAQETEARRLSRLHGIPLITCTPEELPENSGRG